MNKLLIMGIGGAVFFGLGFATRNMMPDNTKIANVEEAVAAMEPVSDPDILTIDISKLPEQAKFRAKLLIGSIARDVANYDEEKEKAAQKYMNWSFD